MEAEYARVPIVISNKSMHVKKRKEELEFELDLIEKFINRTKLQNRMNPVSQFWHTRSLLMH